MQSSLIGKVEKAKLYAQEPERISFSDFSVTVRGDNNTHTTSYKEGNWNCGCSFFEDRGWCCHTMALQKVLGVMLPEEAREQQAELG